MNPWDIAKGKSESAQQRALFAWANMARLHGIRAANDPRSYGDITYVRTTYGDHAAHPALEDMHATPNGGKRDAITGANLKAEGVKAGVPDIQFPVAYGAYLGLFIEMKRAKGGRFSPEQEATIERYRGYGHRVETCNGFEEARAALEKYLRLGRRYIDTEQNMVHI